MLRLFADLGVTLTTAERNAIEQRPTRSLAAFLAYSRGLEAQDDGRFDDAARFFDNAVRLDPGFRPAQQRRQEVKNVVAGSGGDGERRSSRDCAARPKVRSIAGASLGVRARALGTAEELNPSVAGGATRRGCAAPRRSRRRIRSAGTGGDNVTTKTAKVTIVIHQPKP